MTDLGNYDAWKLASPPDDFDEPPLCDECDDQGCCLCDPIEFDDDSDEEDAEWE